MRGEFGYARFIHDGAKDPRSVMYLSSLNLSFRWGEFRLYSLYGI